MSLMKKRDTSNSILDWVLTLLLVLGILLGNTSTGLSQTGDDEWELPVNLSRSGGAANPAVVVDNNGIVHVIWADIYAGFMYSSQNEEGWSQPVAVTYPFSPPRNVTQVIDYPTPLLMIDQRNRAHAFWIDGKGVLYHSSVNATAIGNGYSWAGRRVVAESATAMDVAMDALGNIHVAYVRNLSTTAAPAGIYYRTLNTTNFAWSLPVMLDESPYFRALEPENANVSIETSLVEEQVQVYIAWDNRPRNRIAMIKSIDSGKTWGSSEVVEGPEVSTSPVIPFDVTVGAHGNNLILVWQEDQPGESCTQSYRWSDDGGDTWRGRQRMLTNLQGCAEDNEFIVNQEGQILLMTRILGQVYLMAWDGQQWSDPQLQTMLSSFIDEETFNLVDLRCQYATLTPTNTMYVAGCDTGIGGDVWFTSRQLDQINSWFPTESNWSYPAQVATSASFDLSNNLVSDELGNIHLVWSQANSSNPDGGGVLQYARYDGVTWLPPLLVFGPPVTNVVSPTAAIHAGRLYVAWGNSQTGEISVASAPVDRASNPREWSDPVLVPVPRPAADSPFIIATPDGTIHIAYAIPINEMRGVYLVSSIDEGKSWSDPVVVFDAVEAGWSMVDNPKFTASDENTLQAIFTRHGDNRSNGMYYIRSEDGGKTWAHGEMLTEDPVSYSEIKATSKGAIHLLWQVSTNSSHSLWHALSNDQGLTWENRSSVQTSLARPELSSLMEDSQGGIHLIQIAKEERSYLTLKHWLWINPQWNVVEINQVQVSSDENASALRSAFATDGQLVAVYSMPVVEEVRTTTTSIAAAPRSFTLFSTARTFAQTGENPQVQEPEEEVVVQAPVVPTATPELATPVPTAATAMVREELTKTLNETPVEAQNQWNGLMIGVVVGGVITIFILFLAIRSVRRRGLG